MNRRRIAHDGVLVLGGGLAGLSAALAAAPRPVLVLNRGTFTSGAASAWAQGGIAAALGPGDSAEAHAADTVAAGAGLVDVDAPRQLAEHAPQAVRWLAALGAPFDRTDDGGFSLSLEAAHSRARVARVRGDGAGAAIMEAVTAAALGSRHVRLLDGASLRGLLQDDTGAVRGALVEREGELLEVVAPATVLASGGVGGLYAVTTNPTRARGTGLALAALAGAAVSDPEFVQFHPTAIDVGRDPAPLATEALRGEGARLVTREGAPFMDAVHPDGDLAPRDVVARAVHARVAAGEGAFLDAREAVGEAFPYEFPAVFAACLSGGIDPRRQLIPVAPAAHYHMGGVATDLQGRTSLTGLWAVGEVACTGLHGANRLASNSLGEAVVWGRRAGADAAQVADSGTRAGRTAAVGYLPPDPTAELRRAMAAHAGVRRTAAGLSELLEAIGSLEAASGATAETVAARLIAEGALAREESRGAHQRDDFARELAPAHTRFVLRTPHMSTEAAA